MQNKRAFGLLFRDEEKILFWIRENLHLILRPESRTVVLMKLDQIGEKFSNKNKYN